MVRNQSRSWQAIFVATVVLMVSACGSSEDVNKSAASADTSGAIVGLVIGQQGPVADAAVIVKTADGREVGKATTNAQGEYRIASGQAGPIMGEAKDSSGKAWYGISQNANMHITHLGDFLIRLWYQAKELDVSTVFSGLSASSPMPVEQELTVAANQILSVPANAFGKGSVDLFGNELTSTLSKILQGTRIESEDTIRINVPEIKFNGAYKIKTQLSKQGDVIYGGSEETESANVPLTKGPIEASVGSFKSSGPAKHQLKTSSGVSNESWMKENWEFIKDKKFGELVIPGTHDSGTYKLTWGTGGDTAKTQTNSIGDQLKDGIRYFDLRVREASHRGCADPSVWWLYHTWDSYRLQVALDEIKAFLSKPGNEKEVIILDFQDTKIIYDDGRARDVLLGMVQDKLGPYLAKKDGTWSWQKATTNELVSKNKRVIVLLENFLYTNISKPDFKPGCGVAKIDHNNFANRTTEMVSAYDEDFAQSASDIKYLIESELNQNFLSTRWYDRLIVEYKLRVDTSPAKLQQFKEMIAARVKKYKEYTETSKLRVLQLVSRPPNSWYAGAATISGDDLLTYATREINVPLNFMGSGCEEGWMGKRLRMGVEGDSGTWNAPNIIITDNYKASQWVLPDYQNGRWVKGQNGSYVDLAITLNKIKRDPPRLGGMTDFADGQCLQ